jgi:hypothetical protein
MELNYPGLKAGDSDCLLRALNLQEGFLFIALYMFLDTAIPVSFMLLLSMVMSPVMALLVACIFNTQSILGLVTANQESIREGLGGVVPYLVWPVINGVYLLIPSFMPFGEKVSGVFSNYKVELEQWAYLAYAADYALVIVCFYFLLSVYILRRKNLS